MTLDEVTDSFSEGLDKAKWDANRKWTLDMYNILDDGGVLGIPNTGQVFIKKRWGFVEKVPVER
jgi:hypothetical protein